MRLKKTPWNKLKEETTLKHHHPINAAKLSFHVIIETVVLLKPNLYYSLANCYQ